MTLHLDDLWSCFVCRQRADGLGVMVKSCVGWLCQQCADGGYGMRASHMPVRQFDRYEEGALRRAAEGRAGAYLDMLGRTDLASLHPDEWRHVCRLIVEDFGAGIRAEIGGQPAADLIPVHQVDGENYASEVA